ncbi:ComEA family DNA-binding protein [Paenibacillus harenae]|uniref:ComEA family DNA-binding protein n=1 Tax=Paenibacillus harenae TaxID=306543 RepID=UPI0004087DC6|nr:helix-hairpin-helix domain-containing protein [Paenibacillus harenae]
MMKQPSIMLSNKKLAIAAVCIVCAAALLGAAFFEPKKQAPDEWVPLNDAVGNALGRMEEQNAEAEDTNMAPAAAAGFPVLQATDTPSVRAEHAGEEEKPNAADTGTTAGGQAEPDGRLDINAATAEELDELKGIGPSKAQAIVADREQNGKFKSERDLLRVKGIGEKLLSGMQDSIVAGP